MNNIGKHYREHYPAFQNPKLIQVDGYTASASLGVGRKNKYNNKRLNKNYRKFNKRVINKKPRKEMSRTEYQMLWTTIWLLFIFGLCLLFNHAAPLILLAVWFFGFI